MSFLIVGDGHLKFGLEKLSNALKINKKVIFAGLVEDVSPYICLFDIGLLCSDPEGFSNSLLEYMAKGIAVVATDAGGNKEIIHQEVTAALVPPQDYKSMGDKVCELLKDTEKRLELANNAKSLVYREYGWNTKIKDIETYYYRSLRG